MLFDVVVAAGRGKERLDGVLADVVQVLPMAERHQHIQLTCTNTRTHKIYGHNGAEDLKNVANFQPNMSPEKNSILSVSIS